MGELGSKGDCHGKPATVINLEEGATLRLAEEGQQLGR